MAAMESEMRDADSGSAIVAEAASISPIDVRATVDQPAAAVDEPSWTAKRRELLAWLERVAPEVAPVYAGAVRIAADMSFPGRVCFVWHAIREIRNRLPDALAGEVAWSSVHWIDIAGEVWQRWTDDGWPEDGQVVLSEAAEPSASGPERIGVSRDLLLAVAKVASAHSGIFRRNEANARRFLEAAAGTGVPAYVVRGWVDGGRRAVRLAHVHNKPVDPTDEQSLEADLAAFEVGLLAIVNRSYENMDQLDEILASTNR